MKHLLVNIDAKIVVLHNYFSNFLFHFGRLPHSFPDPCSFGCYTAVCFVWRHEIHVTSQVIPVDKTEYTIGWFYDV